jgi:amino acid transporter
MSEPFRLSVDIKLREKSIIALILVLIIPNTFYWAGLTNDSGYFTDSFWNVNSYLGQSTATLYAGMSYLALISALLIRNRPQVRSLMIVLSVVFQLMSLNQFIIRMLVLVEAEFVPTLRTVFVYSDGFFPLQLFGTLALVPLTYLLRQNMAWLKSEVRKFTANLRKSGRTFKTVCAYLSIVLLVIFVIFGFYTNIKALIDFNGNFYPRGFYPEIPLALIAYVMDVIWTTILIGIVLVYAFNHFDFISNTVKELNTVLRDFRLSSYVTRQISGFLYWLYYVVVVGAFALIGPFQTFVEFEQTRQELGAGFQPQLILILVAGPLLTLVLGYFVILILRLVFELLIALVHIAQNTANARR